MTPSSPEARAQLVTLLGTLFAQIDGPATLGEHADWLLAHGVTLTPAAPREPSLSRAKWIGPLTVLIHDEWHGTKPTDRKDIVRFTVERVVRALDHPTHEGPPGLCSGCSVRVIELETRLAATQQRLDALLAVSPQGIEAAHQIIAGCQHIYTPDGDFDSYVCRDCVEAGVRAYLAGAAEGGTK